MTKPDPQAERLANELPAKWWQVIDAPARLDEAEPAQKSRVAISYARNSAANPYTGSSEQSIERQHEINAQTAKQYDLGPRVEFEDRAVSGKVASRTGLNSALEFARQNQDREVALLLEDADRLSRDVSSWVLIQAQLDALGVSVYDMDGPVAPEEMAVRAAASSREVKKILHRTGLEKLKARLGGRYMSMAPWGYKRLRRAVVAPDAAKIATVVTLFEKSAQGATLSELCRWFDQIGEPPPKIEDPTWHLSTIRSVLRNPIYIGWTRHRLNKALPSALEELILRAEGEDVKLLRNQKGKLVAYLVRTDWTAIVPPNTFEASLDNIDKHRTEAIAKGNGRAGVRRHLILTGVAYCPACGRLLRINSDTRGERTLRCKVSPISRCQQPLTFMLRDIERYLLEGLKQILTTKVEYALEYQRKLEQNAVEKARSVSLGREQTVQALKRMEIDFKWRDENYPRDLELREEHERISRDLLHKIKKLRAKLSETTAAIPLPVDCARLLELAPMLDGLWETAPFVARTSAERALRDSIRALIARVDFRKLSRFESKVLISYDFGRALGIDDPNLRQTIEFDHNGLADLTERRQVSEKLIRSGRFALSDDEYERLRHHDAVKNCFGRLKEPFPRLVLDALVNMTLVDVDFSTACSALGIDRKLAYPPADRLRRSEDLKEFKRALAELRPDAEWAFGKLDMKPRPQRLLRTRLGEDSPVLRLPHCSKATNRLISDAEWEAVSPFVLRKAHPYAARRDLDATFHIIAHQIAWTSLPKSLGSGANISSYFGHMMRNGSFAKIVGVLLFLNGLTSSPKLKLPKLRPKQ